ncbi:hypothetical protein CK203_104902 [Vitis vinifera]|uniref:Uncharacterized protein n=1 Tax=Vitis vinifera TaxID=29760 RepID=A0A438BMZ2_VITVI|nr:hypothetical protein CK203_104902 [Vitis vinifera]
MWFLLFIQSPLLSGGITSSLILSLAFGTLGTMFILVGGRVEETSQSKEKSKEKQGGKQRTAAAVFVGTFGALPEVHFLHAIYHFKAQEVKNPTLQTVYDLELKRGRYGLSEDNCSRCAKFRTPLSCANGVRSSHTSFSQTTSEDVFSEDERLNFRFLGVKEASQPNSEDFSSEDERLGSLSLGVRKSGQVISVHGDALVYLLRALVGGLKVKDHLEWQVLGERYEPLQGASEKKQVTGTPFLYEESEPSDLKLQETLFFVINFVDYSLNQGAQLDTNQLRHQLGMNQMAPLRGWCHFAVISPFQSTCDLHHKFVVHAILNTIAEEAMNFMSYVAEVSRGWDEPNARIWEEDIST